MRSWVAVANFDYKPKRTRPHDNHISYLLHYGVYPCGTYTVGIDATCINPYSVSWGFHLYCWDFNNKGSSTIVPANCQLCVNSFEKNTRVATELSYILGYMDVPRLERHHLVGFVHGGSTFQAPTHYKYNYAAPFKGTLYMYLEYELG